jgi:hypothetical protein
MISQRNSPRAALLAKEARSTSSWTLAASSRSCTASSETLGFLSPMWESSAEVQTAKTQHVKIYGAPKRPTLVHHLGTTPRPLQHHLCIKIIATIVLHLFPNDPPSMFSPMLSRLCPCNASGQDIYDIIHLVFHRAPRVSVPADDLAKLCSHNSLNGLR